MIIIFHGALRGYFGDRVEMHARSVAEALEGVFTQVTDHPKDLVVEAVGFPTEQALRSETDAEEVHVIPSMFGGGGKFGGIILGALTIAAAFVLPGLGVTLGAALKTSLIVSGAMMIAQGVVGLFMKAPTISKSEDPPPSKYLGITENTTAQGTHITLACGRVLLAGHWLTLQSDADKLAFGQFPASPT